MDLTLLKDNEIYLTHFNKKDKEELFNLASDKDIALNCGWNPHKDIKETEHIITHILNTNECYAIKRIEDNKLLGCIELKFKNKSFYLTDDKDAELGFWIGKSYQRKGYCLKAIKLIFKHAFIDLSLNNIYCGYYLGNIPSKNIQEKIGFKKIEIIKHYYVSLINEYKDIQISKMNKRDYYNLYVKDN